MDESEIVKSVVEKLRILRKERGISQAELSRRCRLSRSGLRHMENGDVAPTLQFLLRVARELDVSVADLLRESENR